MEKLKDEISSATEDERVLLEKLQEVRLKRAKVKIKLLEETKDRKYYLDENECKALCESIMKDKNLNGVIAWDEYIWRYSELSEYKTYYIKLSNQILAIIEPKKNEKFSFESFPTDEKKDKDVEIELNRIKEHISDEDVDNGLWGYQRILGTKESFEKGFLVGEVEKKMDRKEEIKNSFRFGFFSEEAMDLLTSSISSIENAIGNVIPTQAFIDGVDNHLFDVRTDNSILDYGYYDFGEAAILLGAFADTADEKNRAVTKGLLQCASKSRKTSRFEEGMTEYLVEKITKQKDELVLSHPSKNIVEVLLNHIPENEMIIEYFTDRDFESLMLKHGFDGRKIMQGFEMLGKAMDEDNAGNIVMGKNMIVTELVRGCLKNVKSPADLEALMQDIFKVEHQIANGDRVEALNELTENAKKMEIYKEDAQHIELKELTGTENDSTYMHLIYQKVSELLKDSGDLKEYEQLSPETKARIQKQRIAEHSKPKDEAVYGD